jgi:hypothetical protein
MKTGMRANPITSTRKNARRTLAPMIEVVERRELLAGGVGVLAGTVFLDAGRTGAFASTDPYLPGATVELFRAGDATPIASTVSDAKGGYAFRGLDPGDYVLYEVPPAGQTVVANQILSDLDPAKSLSSAAIAVTVPDPSKVVVNYYGVSQNGSVGLTSMINGTSTPNTVGALSVSIGSTAGSTDINAGYLSYCIDDMHLLCSCGGHSFPVIPMSITELTNGASTTPISADRAGRIAYLFNHYGNASLTNVQAAGLQLAIWELIYDTGATADFASGNYSVTGPIDASQQAQVDPAISQAQSYFAESEGKSEAALFLSASASPDSPSLGDSGFQSMIARGSFDFLNAAKPPDPVVLSSLSGYKYYDDDHNGIKEPGEQGIAGATITLTGTDGTGKSVLLTTTTDTHGFYQFTNLKAGTYTITDSQSPAYLDGKDTQGTPGTGLTLNDQFKDITLAAGIDGVNNNFGELKPAPAVIEQKPAPAVTGLDLSGKPVPAPAVTGLKFIGIHQNSTTIVLSFDGALDPKQANNPANYSLVALGHDEKLGTADDRWVRIASAVYDPAANAVTLRPDHHINIHYHYALSLTVPAALSSAPAARYVGVFGRSAVPYFTTHRGAHYPAPPLTRREILHDAAVVGQAKAVIARNGGVLYGHSTPVLAPFASKSHVTAHAKTHVVSHAHGASSRGVTATSHASSKSHPRPR